MLLAIFSNVAIMPVHATIANGSMAIGNRFKCRPLSRRNIAGFGIVANLFAPEVLERLSNKVLTGAFKGHATLDDSIPTFDEILAVNGQTVVDNGFAEGTKVCAGDMHWCTGRPFQVALTHGLLGRRNLWDQRGTISEAEDALDKVDTGNHGVLDGRIGFADRREDSLQEVRNLARHDRELVTEGV